MGKKYDTAGLEMRSSIHHQEWLKQVTCPIIKVDGAESIAEIVQKVSLYLEEK